MRDFRIFLSMAYIYLISQGIALEGNAATRSDGAFQSFESGLSAIGVTIAVGLASFIAYFAICTAWFNAQNWR
jgi:hypothetical protein